MHCPASCLKDGAKASIYESGLLVLYRCAGIGGLMFVPFWEQAMTPAARTPLGMVSFFRKHLIFEDTYVVIRHPEVAVQRVQHALLSRTPAAILISVPGCPALVLTRHVHVELTGLCGQSLSYSCRMSANILATTMG